MFGFTPKLKTPRKLPWEVGAGRREAEPHTGGRGPEILSLAPTRAGGRTVMGAPAADPRTSGRAFLGAESGGGDTRRVFFPKGLLPEVSRSPGGPHLGPPVGACLHSGYRNFLTFYCFSPGWGCVGGNRVVLPRRKVSVLEP